MSFPRGSQSVSQSAEVLALKHESRILRQWSNPVSGSPWATQHRGLMNVREPTKSWRQHGTQHTATKCLFQNVWATNDSLTKWSDRQLVWGEFMSSWVRCSAFMLHLCCICCICVEILRWLNSLVQFWPEASSLVWWSAFLLHLWCNFTIF